MTDVFDAAHVAPKTTTDVFVVMNRYGEDYWSAATTWKTLEDAQRSVNVSDTIQAWKIVKVSELPVEVHPGEAGTPNFVFGRQFCALTSVACAITPVHG